MTLLEHQTATLTTPDGELGEIHIERIDGDLVLGEFTPGGGFESVRPVFAAFEDAVVLQALSEVDRLDRQIAALGLSLRGRSGETNPVRDVQIYADGGVSFRLNAVAERNAVHHA